MGKTKKDKQFGETLGALSIKYATDDQAADFMKQNEITAEKNRILFSLSILNTALATVSVNIAMKVEQEKKISILNHMIETLDKLLTGSSGQVSFRTLVPSKEERSYVRSKYGEDNFDTNVHTILDMLYDRRIDAYEKELKSGFANFEENRGSSLGPFSGVIRVFGTHAHGSDTAEDIIYISSMSAMLYNNLNRFMSICKEHQ